MSADVSKGGPAIHERPVEPAGIADEVLRDQALHG